MILAIFIDNGDIHAKMLLEQSGNFWFNGLSGLGHHEAPPELLTTDFGPLPVWIAG